MDQGPAQDPSLFNKFKQLFVGPDKQQAKIVRDVPKIVFTGTKKNTAKAVLLFEEMYSNNSS